MPLNYSVTSTKISLNNIFVLGYDKNQNNYLDEIAESAQLHAHHLFGAGQTTQKFSDLEEMLEQARAVLDSHNSVDGLICCDELSMRALQSILCKEYGLPAPSLSSLLKCAHRYWSKIEQQKSIPENTPYFCAVDPFDEDALENVTLNYPFTLKPMIGSQSSLIFHITKESDFHQAVDKIRHTILGADKSPDEILSMANPPAEVRAVESHYVLAEQYIAGTAFTSEGYVQNGRSHVLAMVAKAKSAENISPAMAQYDGSLPPAVQNRAAAITEKLLAHLGFDHSLFSIEFLWNEESDDLWVTEIKPNLSQSNALLDDTNTEHADHDIALNIALGRPPFFDGNQKDYRRTKHFLRRRYKQEHPPGTSLPQITHTDTMNKLPRYSEPYLRVRKGMEVARTNERDAYHYVISKKLDEQQDLRELGRIYPQDAELLPFESKSGQLETATPGRKLESVG